MSSLLPCLAQRQHSSNPQCILVELYYTKTTRVSLLKGRGGVEGAKRGGCHGNKLLSLSLSMQTHMHTYAQAHSLLGQISERQVVCLLSMDPPIPVQAES